MHNSGNKRSAHPQTVKSYGSHSFPDFENSGRQNKGPLDRRRDCFRRVDFIKGQFVASGGDGERSVDVEKQAFDAGYKEGMLAGRQTAEAELQLLALRLHRSVDDLNRTRQELYTTARTHAVELALAVARKIIEREVKVDRSVVVHSLERALEGMAGEAEVTVAMHPDDLEYLKKLPPGELPETDEIGNEISFTSDPALAPGGCMVRTTAGDRDATVDGQMEVIAEAFEEALQRHGRVLTAETSDDG